MHLIESARARRAAARRRVTTIATVALVTASVSAFGGVPFAGVRAAAAVVPGSGFTQPFAGAPQYEPLGPPQLTRRGERNQPIGQKLADSIAAAIGLSPSDAFTDAQYRAFISGGGVGGNRQDAELVDASVRIFTNTLGRPLLSNVNGKITRTVLASYGLFVNATGSLESLANDDAPTRKANALIAPGGYLDTWCVANGCTASLIALHNSAYSVELPYGIAAQQISEPAQLVKNTMNGVTTEVGMSMVPPIWLINFALLYVLKPSVAAAMPAYWTPIPANVATAILASPTGQVPYSEYASDLR